MRYAAVSSLRILVIADSRDTGSPDFKPMEWEMYRS